MDGAEESGDLCDRLVHVVRSGLTATRELLEQRHLDLVAALTQEIQRTPAWKPTSERQSSGDGERPVVDQGSHVEDPSYRYAEDPSGQGASRRLLEPRTASSSEALESDSSLTTEDALHFRPPSSENFRAKSTRKSTALRGTESAVALYAFWLDEPRASQHVSEKRHSLLANSIVGAMGRAGGSARGGNVHQMKVVRSLTLVERIVMRPPETRSGTAWILMSCAAMCYDAVVMPLHLFFELPQEGFFLYMTVAVTAFWTLDVPWQMTTGFHTKDGDIEMRFPQAVGNYARTGRLWMDLALWLVDIGSLTLTFGILESSETLDPSGVLRLGKFSRVSRFLRLFRLMRGVKIVRLVTTALETAQSDASVMLIKIMGTIVVILIMNHYVACCWFGLAIEMDDGSPDFENWVNQFAFGRRREEVYAISMHWSLAQFTPATNYVQPTNLAERIYVIFVVLIAMVTFSSLLSTITTATMQAKKNQEARFLEEEKLKEFIKRNRVCMATTHQLWHFFRQRYLKQKRPVLEADVTILKEIPESMFMTIRCEMYVPILETHPLLRKYMVRDPTAGTLLCRHALGTDYLWHSQDVFLEGSMATRMFFLRGGCLQYRSTLDDVVIDAGTARSIVMEVALWCRWRYKGRCTAVTPAEMTYLEAQQFQLVAAQRPDSFPILRAYAAAYVKELRQSGKSGPEVEVGCSLEELEQLLREATNPAAPSGLLRGFTNTMPAVQHFFGLPDAIWQLVSGRRSFLPDHAGAGPARSPREGGGDFNSSSPNSSGVQSPSGRSHIPFGGSNGDRSITAEVLKAVNRPSAAAASSNMSGRSGGGDASKKPKQPASSGSGGNGAAAPKAWVIEEGDENGSSLLLLEGDDAPVQPSSSPPSFPRLSATSP